MSKCNCDECNPYGDPPDTSTPAPKYFDMMGNSESPLDAMAGLIQKLSEKVTEQKEELDKSIETCNDLDAKLFDYSIEIEKRNAIISDLRSLILECSTYLDTNNLTSIGYGSILHMKMKEKL